MGLDIGYESSEGLTNESMSIGTGPQQTKVMEFGPFRPWMSGPPLKVVHECAKVAYPWITDHLVHLKLRPYGPHWPSMNRKASQEHHKWCIKSTGEIDKLEATTLIYNTLPFHIFVFFYIFCWGWVGVGEGKIWEL